MHLGLQLVLRLVPVCQEAGIEQSEDGFDHLANYVFISLDPLATHVLPERVL